MPSRAAVVGVAVGAWFLLSGCPDDCERACGKLEYCALIEDGSSRDGCNEACEDREGEEALRCADCLENTACGGIAGGTCDQACKETVAIRKP